ncbi:MAG: hypothetical protein WBQ34_09900 [Candidatus Acidiferrales bacterium]
MSQLTMVDLFCGLGGASEPFRDAGWRVIGVDIESRFKPDIVADLRDPLPLKRIRDVLLWASVPCDGYARCVLPWKNARPGDESTELAEATARTIAEWEPTIWIVECSSLSRKWLTPVFGPVRATIGTSHAFWSNRALLIPDCPARKEKMGPRPDRPAQRAKIPYEIGDAIRRQIEALQ